MRIGIILLCLAYVISQFFRNFLAVLSEQLYLDIGATSDDLAFAMGFWFLTFSLIAISDCAESSYSILISLFAPIRFFGR